MFCELNGSAISGALWDVLPITARTQTWGDEIYFSIPVTADEEDAGKPWNSAQSAIGRQALRSASSSAPPRPAAEVK